MDSEWIALLGASAAVVSAAAAIWLGVRHSTLQAQQRDLQARVVALEEGRELPRLTPNTCRSRLEGDQRHVTIGLHNDGNTDAIHFEVTRALVAVVSSTKDEVHQIVALGAVEEPPTRATIKAGASATFQLLPIAADKLKVARGRKTIVTRIEGRYVRVIDASGSTEDRTYLYEGSHLEREYGFPDISTWRERPDPTGWQGFIEAMK